MKSYPLFVAAVLVLGSNLAKAAEFELKGLRIGMSEADFKKANPGATCEKAYRKPELDKVLPALPQVRTCSIAGFTLATQKATRNQFLFYGGQLGEMFHAFPIDQAPAMQAALTDKFGKPSIDPGHQSRSWIFNSGTSLVWRPEGRDSAYLFVHSDLSNSYLGKIKKLEKKSVSKDL